MRERTNGGVERYRIHECAYSVVSSSAYRLGRALIRITWGDKDLQVDKSSNFRPLESRFYWAIVLRLFIR